jgi:hypothetical protein
MEKAQDGVTGSVYRVVVIDRHHTDVRTVVAEGLTHERAKRTADGVAINLNHVDYYVKVEEQE